MQTTALQPDDSGLLTFGGYFMEREAVKVFTADDNLQADMILDTLNSNGIPAYKKDLGSARIMNLYGGYSKAGEEIYVADSDEEKTMEILRVMGLK